MIIAKTNKELAKEVLSFVSPRAMIQGVQDQYSHIGYYKNNKIGGGVIFSHYDGHNIWMHLALDNPRAMRRSYAKQVFEYCFYTCKCVRITAMTKPTNVRCIKLIESAGFKKEGRIRKVIKENLQYSDGLIYGLLRKECRYL
jgi:RimJ/RimL family protein N-acetyltransferase